MFATGKRTTRLAMIALSLGVMLSLSACGTPTASSGVAWENMHGVGVVEDVYTGDNHI